VKAKGALPQRETIESQQAKPWDLAEGFAWSLMKSSTATLRVRFAYKRKGRREKKGKKGGTGPPRCELTKKKKIFSTISGQHRGANVGLPQQALVIGRTSVQKKRVYGEIIQGTPKKGLVL